MARPGPRNALTDVEGLEVGCAADPAARTGVTLIRAPGRAVAGVSIAGGGPGSRETDLLRADALVDAIDAITLSGGSVYGLAAADAVVAALGAAGQGFRVGPATAPIVPGAILFDLLNGGDKDWGQEPPYRRLAREALAACGAEVPQGKAGAGYGARAGAIEGGQGTASAITADGFTVAALACVNSIGSVLVPGTRAFWAGAFEQGEEFGGLGAPAVAGLDLEDWGRAKRDGAGRRNTTIAVVAVDAALTKAECARVAKMAEAGFARAIRPVFTPFDGDIVFALATGRRPLPEEAVEPRWSAICRLGGLAADCLARAVARGVFAAHALGDIPAWRDLA